MTSSIVSAITHATVIATVSMNEAATPNLNSYIICEGTGDVALLKRFKAGNVIFIPAGNKIEAKTSKVTIDTLTSKAIYIYDKDYDSDILSNNEFLYDYCNLEMMLVFGNDSINTTFPTALSITPLNFISLRDEALRRIKIVSLYRKHESGTTLAFKCDEYIMNHEIDCLGTDAVFENNWKSELIIKCPRASTIISDLNMDVVSFPDSDLKEITRGHDFFLVFYYLLKNYALSIPGYSGRIKTSGDAYWRAESLQKLLMKEYSEKDFKSTSLYQNIYTYQSFSGLSFFCL